MECREGDLSPVARFFSKQYPCWGNLGHDGYVQTGPDAQIFMKMDGTPFIRQGLHQAQTVTKPGQNAFSGCLDLLRGDIPPAPAGQDYFAESHKVGHPHSTFL